MRKGFGLLPEYRSGFVKQLWVPGNCRSNCEMMVLLLQPFRVGFKREIAQSAGLETAQLTETSKITEIEEVESETHYETEEKEQGRKIEENKDQDTVIIDSLMEEELKQGKIAPKGNAFEKIRNEEGAKNLATKIIQNLSSNSSRYIYMEDLMGFMNINDARKVLKLLGCASECQKVHKLILENWVVNIFKERRSIELTRSNSKSIVKKLNWILIFVYFIVTFVRFSLMFKLTTVSNLVFLVSAIFLAGFVFGNTCKIAFEAVIYLFVMHPFNIDDRCEIDGVELVVNKINIFSTVFLRNDNQIIIYPNAILWTKSVSNFRLSPPTRDKIEFDIFILSPEEQIIAMEQRILSFIQSREELWFPTPRIFITSIGETSRLHVEVWATHRINMQDLDERLERKKLLYKEVANIIRELGILVHW
ncbi:Mechanosensitive ion channel domain-containing protein [Theobroma cacao]|uniref:Mechanosensitive ion channel domain-containing protein n=1 Tax=Theobroma cacao TaxID=3641 RepID=A0A061DYT6_THECC|nr:Mechanosensitive ion channel domain-containing protein [Theobroma cacao]